jgi:CubicO group peptidase (beta-lactamase class C family)
VSLHALLLCLAPFAGGSPSYFPPTTPGDDSWETVTPSALGWEEAGLAPLEAFLEDSGTQGFLVLHAGRIAFERYFGSWTLHDTHPVFSVTKSMTATQLGRLQSDGLLDLDDPVTDYLGPGWSAASPAQELAVTVRDAAAMASGLSAEFAFVDPPGQVWLYNTPVYRELIDVIESASGLSRAAYADAILWTPIGMHDTSYAPGDEFMQASARDLARFGLLVARGGTWETTTVVDGDFALEMRTSSQALNPSYGLLWWLNGQASWISANGTTGSGSLVPTGPDDMTMALGAFDQKVYVVPSLDLVVVRIGASAGSPQGVYDTELWARLSAVFTPSTFCDTSDGALSACPCANLGAPETGCELSQATGGVRLSLVEQQTSFPKRVTWQGAGFPTAGAPTALVIRSSTLTKRGPVVFGDGLRCVGVPVVRLAAAFASGGTSVHTHGHGISAGEFYYQLWFRNTPGTYCTPDAFNLSSGRTLTW